MNNILSDLKYAFRILIKRPAITGIALVALGLGIGANSAIFSVVHSVLLKPLPYTDPQRLVLVWDNDRVNQVEREWPGFYNYFDWVERNRVFQQMAAFAGWGPNLTGEGDPQRLSGERTTWALFETFGVHPVLGRSFTAADDRADSEPVVILSHGLWQNRFAGDPDIVGKTVALNDVANTVIGVMPEGFRSIFDAEIWTTFRVQPDPAERGRSHFLWVVARLREGVTLQQARSEMHRVAAQLEQEFPDTNAELGVTVTALHEHLVNGVDTALVLLMVGVGLVLLITCGNIASLQLARATARRRELAVRTALGAGRVRIARQLLTESLLLALLGGALGVIVAVWAVSLLHNLMPANVPSFLYRLKEFELDPATLLFTAAATLVSGVLSGLVPALRTSFSGLTEDLREGGYSASAGRASRRTVSGLVVLEVALALMLLVGAGLLMRSFVKVLTVDPGFNANSVLSFGLVLPQNGYPERAQVADFFDRLLQRLDALPGVESAGMVSFVPMGGGDTDTGFHIGGRPVPRPEQTPAVWYRPVSPGYFQTMEIPLIRGRRFTPQDGPESNVVVIGQAMARRFWGDEDPVGARLRLGDPREGVLMEVVGVVGSVRQNGLDQDAKTELYLPHPRFPRRSMTVVLRTAGDPLAAVRLVRATVWELDNRLPISNINSMQQLLSDSLAQTRLLTTLVGVFAAVAVVLAAVGIFGVLSYSVTQRSQEIGVRVAMGAERGDVVRLILKKGMGLALAGIALGLVAAFFLTRTISSLLYGVSAADPVTFAAVPALLVVVALLACYLPARRASRVDPLVTLRCE